MRPAFQGGNPTYLFPLAGFFLAATAFFLVLAAVFLRAAFTGVLFAAFFAVSAAKLTFFTNVPRVDPIATAAVSRMPGEPFAGFDFFMISLCTYTFPHLAKAMPGTVFAAWNKTCPAGIH